MRLLVPLLLVILLSACAGLGSGRADADRDVVAIIGSERITLEDFERQYSRSLPDSADASQDSLGAYQDFLQRYVDFRLKVREADSAGYDSREDLIQEMSQYRGQLARPYLLEREVVEPLIQDLWDKKQEMVDVSHILLRVDPDAAPNDTARVYARMVGLLDSLASGADFGDLAGTYSEDPSAKDATRPGYRGRLGVYSGGRMVKPFEDRMYSTPVDSVSEIFRSQFGYHILKVHDRRAKPTDRRVAHIMIQPRGQTPADTLDAAARLDSTLAMLRAGQDFAQVAQTMSDDRQSAPRGGDLDFVGFDGWLPPEMRDVAFALESEGNISDPVQTRFGHHIVKLLAIREPVSFEEAYEDLKSEVARLPRANQAEAEFAAQIRAREGARIDSSWVNEMLGQTSADSVLFAISNGTIGDDMLRREVAFLGTNAYTVEEFGTFASSYRGARQLEPQRRFQATLDAFLDDRAIELEVSALEARDENFRRTMQEFRDGLMLFRLMEDSVWTAANQDSSALMAHFEANRDNYRFPDRTRILGIASSSDSLMQVIHGLLEAGTPYAAILDAYQPDSTVSVRFDTTLVEGETSSIYDRAFDQPVGGHTEVLTYSAGRIVLINDGVEPSRPKTFREARAEVVSEYQTTLEERLVAGLRNKYGVVTYPERLSRAFAPAVVEE
ncbi:MAG: peptidylprolyl isomerase [Rhodothermales bacterium]|nr:peptidylprolyl isomerase [Rhodothermales bacterium]MBO6781645.1 peptidylprolyl isomerase [Rhodothermales bacterium]